MAARGGGGSCVSSGGGCHPWQYRLVAYCLGDQQAREARQPQVSCRRGVLDDVAMMGGVMNLVAAVPRWLVSGM